MDLALNNLQKPHQTNQPCERHEHVYSFAIGSNSMTAVLQQGLLYH